MATLSSADPIFPLDIERDIFKYALAQQGLIPFPYNLVLVAKRVHHWLSHKLYDTIVVHETQDYPNKWDRTKLEKYGQFVRNLFVWQAGSQSELSLQCLSSCPNVVNLVFWVPTPSQEMVDVISRLPLTHLSIDLDGIEKPTPGLINMFSKVTHLDCLNRLDLGLGHVIHFTSLTHLAVPFISITSQTHQSLLFNQFPKLNALISWDAERDGNTAESVKVIDDFDDPDEDEPRVVNLLCPVDSDVQNWLDEIRSGRGIWGLAIEAIVMRILLADAIRRLGL
ncbi:hypothetical protein BDN72DRAFT_840169 [Pluteus cervinus]|uniref:Uncharacterized protein n=1 Tax=Pluteus cervinus TaxID=181527 RepID=A0ACD3AUZ7_9AGAR|nr:hypothetical protein BDN72DRAFT_840169 [Pluteus cervinus]